MLLYVVDTGSKRTVSIPEVINPHPPKCDLVFLELSVTYIQLEKCLLQRIEWLNYIPQFLHRTEGHQQYGHKNCVSIFAKVCLKHSQTWGREGNTYCLFCNVKVNLYWQLLAKRSQKNPLAMSITLNIVLHLMKKFLYDTIILVIFR